jgi:phosphoribosylanthranilate isomerase
VFVKICGITNERDALLAVALGADALGFVFAASSRQVTASRVYDITRRLPPEILTVGVFRDEHPQRVVQVAGEAGVKAVQLHGRETPAQVAQVRAEIPRVIKAVAAGSDTFDRAGAYDVEWLLVDSPNPGSGQMFDWSVVDAVPTNAKLILAGGLTPDNVAAAIATVEPWGVDVASGVEATPGHKDARRLQAFIEAARTAGRHLDDLHPAVDGRPNGDAPYDWADE